MEATDYLSSTTLPNGMVSLNSVLGQEMLNAGPEKVLQNEKMILLYKAQVNKTYCGPASLALVINGTNTALRIKVSYCNGDPEELQQKITAGESLTVDEDDVVNFKGLKEYFQNINIDKHGMTLEQISYVVSNIGYGVDTYFVLSEDRKLSAEKESELTALIENGGKKSMKNADEFRQYVKDLFRKPATGLICNYDMARLGYVEYGGHFSPIAAYNSERDAVLVMDVWPKTQPAWVNLELFFSAMSGVDSMSGLPRGFLRMYELL